MRSEQTAFDAKAVRRPLELKHPGARHGRQRTLHHGAATAPSGA